MKNITVRLSKHILHAKTGWHKDKIDTLYEKYNSPDYASTFCMLKLADIGTRSTFYMKNITVRIMQAHFCMVKQAGIGTRSTLCMTNMTVRIMQAHFAC